MMSRSSSGSMRSDSAEEPTMSQNNTVSCRRSASFILDWEGFCEKLPVLGFAECPPAGEAVLVEIEAGLLEAGFDDKLVAH